MIMKRLKKFKMKKILFIGNSHTYMNDMPELVRRMVEDAAGEECQVFMLAYSGRSLKWYMDEEYFSERFNIGTFYVTDESIYVLFDRTDTPTEEDFIESGNIICSQDMEQNVDGQLTRITNDGDTCTCLLSNTLTESGFYSEYEWTKGKGLTYFRSGYGAEGEPIEIKMQNE